MTSTNACVESSKQCIFLCCYVYSCRYMAEILTIWSKTLSTQSINRQEKRREDCVHGYADMLVKESFTAFTITANFH